MDKKTKQLVYRQKLKREGRCTSCSRKLEKNDNAKCKKCKLLLSKRARTVRIERQKSGVCVNCGHKNVCNKKIDTKNFLCETCCFKEASKHSLGTPTLWKELKTIFDNQKGLCYYTGIVLTIGQNASLDHTKALAKGGKGELSNFRWVAWKINLMKRDLNENDFFSLCEDVVRVRDLGGEMGLPISLKPEATRSLA